MRYGGRRGGDGDSDDWPDVGEVPDYGRRGSAREGGRHDRFRSPPASGRPWRLPAYGLGWDDDPAGFEGTEGSFGTLRPSGDFPGYGMGAPRRDYGDWEAAGYGERAYSDWPEGVSPLRGERKRGAAWEVPGPYAGVGPAGYQRPDDRIHDEICERMTRHGTLDASRIRVDVRAGEVTIEGKVTSRWAKRVAEDLAANSLGVRDVHNRLRIEDA